MIKITTIYGPAIWNNLYPKGTKFVYWPYYQFIYAINKHGHTVGREDSPGKVYYD